MFSKLRSLRNMYKLNEIIISIHYKLNKHSQAEITFVFSVATSSLNVPLSLRSIIALI